LATRRTVLIVNLILSLFFLMNVISIWAGLNLYPGGWRFVLMGAVMGNLLWLLIPMILKRQSSPFLRVSRAILGPFWVFWTLLVFLYSCFLLLLGLVWALLSIWKTIPFDQFAYLPSSVFLGGIAFMTVVGFIQALFMVKLEKVLVRVKNLPAEFAGFKIAMVSDLHVGHFTRLSRLKEFARVAQESRPDLFVVCGDITDDDPHYLPKFLRSLEVLESDLLAVGVLGNHDVYANPEKTLLALQDSRLQMLVNEGMVIQRGSASLWLAGVGDQGARRIGQWGSVAPDFDKALEGRPAGAPTVLLAHQPQGFKDAVERKVELTLSGHTHGGQVGFKILNWSLAKLFMKYHMGLFQEGESQLYVTPGTGYWTLPVRFGLTPEVSLIELQPA
jgi:predicted MPP superfamily phosphohydrolase